MKILLFGATGQVGWELQRSLAPLGELIALGTRDTTMCGDLSNLAGIQQTVSDVAPDVIVNAGAYTAVDKAESEKDLAAVINSEAPGILGASAKKIGALLVHYSTDYVFDGSGVNARSENDLTGPLSVYGQTKLEGEKNIQSSCCDHLIFRSSWIYASRGTNFAKTMLRLATEREKLNIIDDQIGAPTGADLISDITSHAVRRAVVNRSVSGIYHLAAAGSTSWYEYARFVIEHARKSGAAIKVAPENILPIPTEQYPTPATRPKNSRLDTTKITAAFDIILPRWETGIQRLLVEIGL